jgi:catechol 2,3-dioxygenase-like lactoylglutathione lyase family enzyme
MDARGITPILNVSDLPASFAWFAKLGWARLWDWGDPPDFGAVGSGECEIFLCQGGQGGRGEGLGVWMTIWVEDVDAVHRTCLAEGLEVTWPPTDEPWGVREMRVRHPDGHVFRVSRGLERDHHHDHDHHHHHPQDHHHPHNHDHDHPHEHGQPHEPDHEHDHR